MSMTGTDNSFTSRTLRAFKRISEEIAMDTLEHDFSPRFAKYFVEGVLGYKGNEYAFERGRTDITLLDESGRRVVLIETKRPKEDLNAEAWRDQAGKYADPSTRFVGLVNGFRFLLWEIEKSGQRRLRVDLDSKTIIDHGRTKEERLTTKEAEQVLFLQNITREEVYGKDKYRKFNDFYATIDVSEDDGFNVLIEQLNYISANLLRQYTYSAFDEYYAGFAQYKQAIGELEELRTRDKKDSKSATETARIELKTQGMYRKYSSFSGYHIWKALSNRPEDKDEENKQIFCKESIYVLINRLLFIRICEDKGLLKTKISNGGIERLREDLSEPIVGNSEVFKQIIRFSYGGAQKIYYHFYEKDNPLDWYESGNGELDWVLNRVLWALNQFNFARVDRDILGKLYEKYLPKEERKRLGEFYTPDAVIDYILDSVEYVPSRAIEGKSLIDPACGSGGFLVRAARRLIARHATKFGKATPKEALDNKSWDEVYERLTPKECEEIINSIAARIHGFDINPFAVNISEMNLLFQVVDLYSKAVKGNPTFTVPRFNIYETDSLELPTNQTNLAQFHGITGKSLAKDKDSTDALKKKKYDFVVGNPPYVNTSNLDPTTQLDYYRSAYSETIFRNFDLYIPFIQLGVRLTSEKGRMSYICSNQFMVKDYGKKLRSYLSRHAGIKELIDFGDNKVFDSATNYPLIFMFAMEAVPTAMCAKVLSIDQNIFADIRAYKKSGTESQNLSFFEISSDQFSDGPWLISSKGDQILTKRIGTLPRLSSKASFVSGLRTGKDGAYFGLVEDTGQPLQNITTGLGTARIEPEIIKPTLKGRDVRRWRARASVSAIYPHTDDPPHTISTERMSKDFPNTLGYLKDIKSVLDKRKWFRKTATELHGEFYAMMYFDLPSDFAKAEIVTPALTKEPNFALNDENALFIGGTAGVIGVCPTMDKYTLLGILNSRVFAYYLRTQPIKSGGYRQLSVNGLSQFHIPNKNAQLESEISSRVKQLLKARAKSLDISESEEAIHSLVFELYGITKEERRVIELALRDQ